MFASGPIFLVGFSLGGMSTCNFLGRSRARITAAVAVSGSFRADLMLWDRYRSVFQKVIVPGLISVLHGKYASQIDRVLGAAGVARLNEVRYV
jgi:pimeloyl-ACP methyl ester carboxylesterase